jgi:hypothetical protein
MPSESSLIEIWCGWIRVTRSKSQVQRRHLVLCFGLSQNNTVLMKRESLTVSGQNVIGQTNYPRSGKQQIRYKFKRIVNTPGRIGKIVRTGSSALF